MRSLVLTTSAWFLAFGAACGAPSEPARPVIIHPVDAAPPDPPTVASAAPEVRAVTPGTIACGSASCKLDSEVCCVSGAAEPRCVAQSHDGTYPCDEGEKIRRCDESADCSAGSRCCRTWGCTGGCPEEWACEEKACAWGTNEVCPAGAACSDGFACKTTAEITPTCQLAPAPAPRCGAETCRAGERCCWDADKSSGHCASSCPEDGTTFMCTSPESCGGYACGAMKILGDPSPGVVFHCAGVAELEGTFSRTLCNSVADCPRRMGSEPVGCEASEAMPGLRECTYGQ